MIVINNLSFLLPAVLAWMNVVSGLPSCKPSPAENNQPAKAIYLLTNEKDNGVVALSVQADGTLAEGTVTLTGGAGAVHIDDKGQPAAPDGLVSQSAIAIAGHHLFAVNPGSNSISLLSIDPRDPTKLEVIGGPATLPGDFPNTVAVSRKNKLVCVGLTGAKAGISCASFSRHGLGSFDQLRPFDLKQTTPPSGPPNTVSHTLFSDDESLLLTTVKGDPSVNNTGFLSVFPVEKPGTKRHEAASLARTGTFSSPNGTALLFGSSVIPGTTNIVITDPAFGAAILSVDPSTHQSTTLFRQTIEGQKAICWATISPKTQTAFVTDVGVNRLIEISLSDASIISILDLSSNGDQGLIDLRAAGQFIYALAPNNGSIGAAVTVVDVSGGPGSGRQIQHFALDELAGKNAQGLATLL